MALIFNIPKYEYSSRCPSQKPARLHHPLSGGYPLDWRDYPCFLGKLDDRGGIPIDGMGRRDRRQSCG